MPTQLQIRRGSTTDHNSFTGAAGELTVDTTKDTLRVHDGSTAGGFELARADGSNLNNITSNISFADNAKAQFGNSSDLQIYHDGSSSVIHDTGTGHLRLHCNDLRVRNEANTEALISANQDGAVELFYNGAEKLATTSTGIDVTGNIQLSAGADRGIIGPDFRSLNIFANPNSSDEGIKFSTDGGTTTEVFIQDGGNIGIGTISPAALLNTKGNDALLMQTVASDNYGFHVTVAHGANMVKLGALDSADGSKDGSTITFGDFGRNIQFSTDKGASLAEAMRITSSGNLLVGKTVSNPSVVGLEARSDGLTAITRDGSNPLIVNRTTSDGSIAEFRKDNTTVGSIGTESGDLHIYSSASGHKGLRFGLGYIAPANNSGVIDDNNVDLGYGGGSPARFKSLYLSSTALIGAENSSPTTGGVYIGGGSVGLQVLSHATGTVSGNWYHAFKYGSNVIGSITQSGTTAVAYNTSSDQRLKENIVDAPSASDDIDAIQVRSFDWKADGSHQKYGMVAQELLTVAPGAVSQGLTEEDMMGVDYSKLVPMLVKEIQSLRTRVAQLETN